MITWSNKVDNFPSQISDIFLTFSPIILNPAISQSQGWSIPSLKWGRTAVTDDNFRLKFFGQRLNNLFEDVLIRVITASPVTEIYSLPIPAAAEPISEAKPVPG